MNYDEFSEVIKGRVEELVREKYDDALVVIRTVTKNNNIKMRAISIVRKEENATPTIYIKNYYEDYKQGRRLDDICQEIVSVYEGGINRFKSNFNAMDILDLDKIRGNIFYKLVNYDMNMKMLESVPHFKYLDLAIVFYIMVSCDEEGQASVLIQNSYLDNWNITAKELRDLALNNTWRNYPAVIKKMEDIVAEMILGDIIHEDDTDFVREEMNYGELEISDVKDVIKEEVEKLKIDRNMQMYVLTNSIRNNGAACLTYPGLLRDFANEHESDVYIIPSSIHEVILIPECEWDKDFLDGLVVEVNDNELDPVEILSYHTYLYRRSDGEIHY